MINDREGLTIKPVPVSDVAQFNDLLRYVFQVTNQDLIEGGYEDGELMHAKQPVLEKSDVIGWYNETQLISQLAIYPCHVNIHGQIFKMAGLTGVGTYPEYAGHGLMHDLIKVGLKRMRANQQWVSFLYPYNIPFYRKKGWEIMSDHLTFDIRDTQLPKQEKVPGFVERCEIDEPDVFKTYDAFAHQTHGAMIRDQLAWDEYWRWENEEERTAAIYYNVDRQPMGYVIYWIAEEVFHIKEMIYLNQDARIGLWNFISAHYSMVNHVKGNIYKDEPIAFLLDDGDIKETIEPYYMARIVDVKEFLQAYPFEKEGRDFYFELTDPMADWNNGIFSVHFDTDGQVEIGTAPVGLQVQCDIQTLTTMLMSYQRPSYLEKIERLQGNHQAIKNLERIIPVETPYFSDYF